MCVIRRASSIVRHYMSMHLGSMDIVRHILEFMGPVDIFFGVGQMVKINSGFGAGDTLLSSSGIISGDRAILQLNSPNDHKSNCRNRLLLANNLNNASTANLVTYALPSPLHFALLLSRCIALVFCEDGVYEINFAEEWNGQELKKNQEIEYQACIRDYFSRTWGLFKGSMSNTPMTSECLTPIQKLGRRIVDIEHRVAMEAAKDHRPKPIQVDESLCTQLRFSCRHRCLKLENGVTVVYTFKVDDNYVYHKSTIRIVVKGYQKYRCITPEQRFAIFDAVAYGPDSFILALDQGLMRFKVDSEGNIVNIQRHECGRMSMYHPQKLAIVNGYQGRVFLLVFLENTLDVFDPERLIPMDLGPYRHNDIHGTDHHRGVSYVYAKDNMLLVFHKLGIVVYEVDLQSCDTRFVVYHRYTLSNRREYHVIDVHVSITDDIAIVVLLRACNGQLFAYTFTPFDCVSGVTLDDSPEHNRRKTSPPTPVTNPQALSVNQSQSGCFTIAPTFGSLQNPPY